MKLLPHYFKWIGITIFFTGLIISAIDDGRQGFINGWNDAIDDPSERIETEFNPVFPKRISHIADYMSLFGLLFYILSKNKIEDEFIQKLRYESAFFVFTLSILILLIIYAFNDDFKVSPSDFLSLQMIAYLIVRSVKRKVILFEDYEEQS